MPETNSTCQLHYRVRDSDLAKNLSEEGGDAFPEVLATSRMIALMELAAARLMKSELKEGELSVGVVVDVKHLAATVEAEVVTVRATFLGMDGKFFTFSVELHDGAGLAGSGYHTRAIVNRSRLLDGARKRRATSST